MPLRTEHVEVGTRVSYEDMANPLREGVVLEILEHGGKTTPSGYPLPGGTEYRVRWDASDDDPCIACGAYGGHDDGCTLGETTSDLRQHGWHILADLPGSIFDGAPIISSYTRLDAIRDGVLTPTTDLTPDEPDFARQAGWVARVDLTAAVAALVVPTDREANERYQDVKGRLWDVVSMAKMYRPHGQDQWFFPCIFQLAGPERARWTKRACQKTVRLKVVLGSDEDGPVATIMLPEED